MELKDFLTFAVDLLIIFLKWKISQNIQIKRFLFFFLKNTFCFRFIYFIYLSVLLACMYMCVSHMCLVLERSELVPDPLKLELVVSHNADVGDKIQVLCEVNKCS